MSKVVVITGGSKGIGYAIAERLLESGAKVFICARNKHELKRAIESLSSSGTVEGEICDVRSETQVEMMLAEAKRVFGGIDILINNAGVGVFGKTVEELSGEQFRQTLEANLFGVFYACHMRFRCFGNGAAVTSSIFHRLQVRTHIREWLPTTHRNSDSTASLKR